MSVAESDLISSLLEDEHFLSRVLSHLIDFGLHECRRVCRKWKDVCRRLPVKLKNIPIDKMADIPLAFPNVVRLSSLEGHVPKAEMSVLHSFSRLTNLNHLEINLSALSFTIDQHFPTWFATLGQLTSFRVYGLVNAAPHFFEALENMRQLTKLEFARDQGDAFQIDAIVPLKGLQELSIYMSQMTATQGEALFLSMPHLTKLKVTQDILNMTTPPLVVLAPHMHQLKSLSLDGLYDVTTPTNWLSLFSKIQLEELRIRYIVRGLPPSGRRPCENIRSAWSPSVFPDILAIRAMIQLTSLDLCFEALRKKDVWEAISALANLKSLKLTAQHWMEDDGGDGDPPCPIANLTKLTSLSLIGHGLGQDARRLTNLVELEFTQDHDSELLLQHALPQLPRLERLVIQEMEGDLDPTTISAFALLKNLKSLSLEYTTCIDVRLFEALASLPELAELRYDGYPGHVVPHSFIREVTRLKQLHRLSFLGDGVTMKLFDIFEEGSYSHIMYLHSNLMKHEYNNIHQVFRRLPCLRSFNICTI